MDWKVFAIDRLQQYEAKRQALEVIPLQIAEIESELTSIRSARTDTVHVRGGNSDRDGRILSCIVRRDDLQQGLERARLWVDIVDKGLSVLDDTDRLILDRFYIHPAKGNVDRLCGELFLETSSVYRKKDRALHRFTVALYGGTES